MKIKQLYIGHALTLLIGSLIYILFRKSTLKMFFWFETIGIMNLINQIRKNTTLYGNKLPDIFLYSLPDGFWIFSYISLILYLWKNELKTENLLWIFMIPLIAILSEIGQLMHIVPGTFDILDLLMYLLGTTLPFIIYKKSITINLLHV